MTLSSYLDIKARSRLLMKGSFVVATKSRKTWARCLLNSLSNMPNPNNILKAECYPEATAWQNGTCFKDVDKLGRQEFDMAEPRIRLGMVGGGEGAFIGAVHRIAARLDDRYELVAGALSASPDKAIGSAAAIGWGPIDPIRTSEPWRGPRPGGPTLSKRLRSSHRTICMHLSLPPFWRRVFISSAINR